VCPVKTQFSLQKRRKGESVGVSLTTCSSRREESLIGKVDEKGRAEKDGGDHASVGDANHHLGPETAVDLFGQRDEQVAQACPRHLFYTGVVVVVGIEHVAPPGFVSG
jgi:hypothetical protein